MNGKERENFKWVQWHLILGPDRESGRQDGVILEVIEPLVRRSSLIPRRFHFFRYYSAHWRVDEADPKEVRNYITFRAEVQGSEYDSYVDEAERTFAADARIEEVIRIPGEYQLAANDYGGAETQDVANDFFHCVCTAALVLLRLSAQEDLAREWHIREYSGQWAHMVTNPLGADLCDYAPPLPRKCLLRPGPT